MKQIIKKLFVSSLAFIVTFILTMIAGIWVYAASYGTVTSGDTLTADLWNAMAGNYDFSTGEIDTGKKWIDGKPIYRKVVNLGNLSAYDTTSYRTFSLGLDNPDFIVDSSRYFNGQQHYNAYFHWNNQFRSWVEKHASNGTANLRFISTTHYNNSLLDVRVIVEYTKTTD